MAGDTTHGRVSSNNTSQENTRHSTCPPLLSLSTSLQALAKLHTASL